MAWTLTCALCFRKLALKLLDLPLICHLLLDVACHALCTTFACSDNLSTCENRCQHCTICSAKWLTSDFHFFSCFSQESKEWKWIKVSQSELKWVKVSQKESNLAQISQKKSKWVKILHITYRNATWLIFQVRIQCVLPQSRHHKRHSVADTCSSKRSQENPYAETLKCSTDFSKEPTLWRVCIEKLMIIFRSISSEICQFCSIFYIWTKMT